LSVQIIENWSDVVAKVEEISPSPDMTGFSAVEMLVEQVNEVTGFANLLDHAIGKKIVVYFPDDRVESLDVTAGRVISCRVRRASLTMNFVHREHISVRTA
jgi:hypothetical protein